MMSIIGLVLGIRAGSLKSINVCVPTGGLTVFIESCTCIAFVWYLLHAVMPPSHNISAILTYRRYVYSS